MAKTVLDVGNMKLKELADKTIAKLKDTDLKTALVALRAANQGAVEDVLNTNGCANYAWWPQLIDEVKPKQIVELGGAMGVGTVMMLQSKYQDYHLYSITLAEGGLEFAYVVDKYPNLTMIVGDDLDMKNWEGVDLAKTDIWYIDSLHTENQLRRELELYTPYFKKGAIVVFDDIRMPELYPVWKELTEKYEHVEMTDPLHFTGYGMIKI